MPGGLGERLGYSGIKVALPTESATGTCYLQLYAESILALQARAGALLWELPLARVIVNAQPAPLADNEDLMHALLWARADNSVTASRVARATHAVCAAPQRKIDGVGAVRGKLVAAALVQLREGRRPGQAIQFGC